MECKHKLARTRSNKPSQRELFELFEELLCGLAFYFKVFSFVYFLIIHVKNRILI